MKPKEMKEKRTFFGVMERFAENGKICSEEIQKRSVSF